MQDRLEDFIKNNRDQFDDSEAPKGVWDRIDSELQKEDEKVKTLPATSWYWKAAVVILLGAVTFLMADRFRVQDQLNMEVSSHADFKDLEAFYTSLISEKEMRISDQIGEEEYFSYLQNDIEELDAIYKELKQTFDQYQETPEMVNRLAHLLRQKLHLIDSQLEILDQMNTSSKENNLSSSL